MDDNKLLTVDEVAVYLRITCHTVRKFARTGIIKAIKMNKDWRFKKEYIDDYVERCVNNE